VRGSLARFALGERLHVAAVEPCDDLLDWYLARYRVDAHPRLRSAQPLLYLDVDVVCDRPLEPLLAMLTFSPAIHACREGLLGEGHPDSAGHWFGWRLMQADGMPFDPNERGFSAGVLGAANADLAGSAYDLVVRCAYGFAASTGDRHRFLGYDQAYANYVLKKLGRIEINALPRLLNLFRVPPQGLVHPDPRAARGLVHFLGVPTAQKRDAMSAYITALKATPIP
jgi:hypothetical protein